MTKQSKINITNEEVLQMCISYLNKEEETDTYTGRKRVWRWMPSWYVKYTFNITYAQVRLICDKLVQKGLLERRHKAGAYVQYSLPAYKDWEKVYSEYFMEKDNSTKH
jgi:hypothetical protein